ncbi:calcium-binding protein [Pseudomonas sp. Irchel 3A7]|uniref:calcium-binding protein n=1 Tax=Pseudomonas sp. Irchel 3A7 TaxID=2008913 RepID=UPI000BA3D9EC|nr:calcium-binding protein [Pseudomonas sp. Irchel 3A7]
MPDNTLKTWFVEYLARHGTALAVGNGFGAESDLDPDWITDGQARNAIIHTHVSTAWTNEFGVGYAEWLGDMKERYGNSDPADMYKDQYNNEVGRQIGVWMATNGYTVGTYSLAELEDIRDALVMDAFNNGDLIVDATTLDENGIDARITNLTAPTWTAPNSGWETASIGRDYDHEIPGTNISDQFFPSGWLDGIDEPETDPLDENTPLPTIPQPLSPIDLPSWMPGVTTPWGNAQNTSSPIVLDVDASGTIELAALNGSGSVYWDIDNDGFTEAAGWITGGDGLLCADANSDGTITHSELFGNNATYANGYLKLDAAYDSNNDNFITSADTNFGNLRVWVDANADGLSQSGELYTLAGLGITSISTSYSNVSYTISGNEVKQESTFTMNGNSYTSADVWFSYDNVNTQYTGSYDLDIRTLFLPELRGYGTLPDLHIAMSQNEDLLDLVMEIAAEDLVDIFDEGFGLRAKVEALMYEWAGVEGVSPTSRLSYIDARQVGFLEAFMGEYYQGSAGSYVYGNQATALKPAWSAALDMTMARIVAQLGVAGEVISDAVYNPVTDAYDGTAALNLSGTEDLADTLCAGKSDIEKILVWKNIVSVIDHAIGMGNLSMGDESDLLDIIHNTTSMSYLTLDILTSDSSDVFWGNSAAETLQANNNDNLIVGEGGNDTLTGYDGNDQLYSSSGDDSLSGNSGHDHINGGTGIDYLYGGTGNDTYYFSAGFVGTNGYYDSLIEEVSEGTDTLRFVGIDVEDLRMWSDSNRMYFSIDGSPDDVLRISYAYDYSTPGYDINSRIEQIVFDDSTTWDLTAGLIMTDTDANHTMNGTAQNDVMDGRGGYDSLSGYNGNDTLYGGDDGDSLSGNNGNDHLYGGAGADYLYGGTGNDTYYFSAGFVGANGYYDNLIEEVSEGTDTLRFTGIDVEDLRMWSDSNRMYFSIDGSPDDVLRISYSYDYSTPGYDINSRIEQIVFDDTTTWDLTAGLIMTDTDAGHSMNGTAQNDVMAGRAGYDSLSGYNGNDILYGGDDNDYLYGGNGNDMLYGGAGVDNMTGDAGADKFVFEAASAFSNIDVIADFTTGDGDSIDLVSLLGNYDPLTELITDFVEMTTSGSNTILKVDQDGTGGTYGWTQIATLQGVTGLTDEAALVSNGNLVAA